MDSVDPARSRGAEGRAPDERGLWLAAAVLVLLAGVSVGVPAAAVVSGVVRHLAAGGAGGAGHGVGGAAGGGRGWVLLALTMAYAGGIGVLATALAWPVAWAIGAGRGRLRAALAAMCAVPLLLPNYLAYAGLNLLRAPRTPIGDWLAGQEPWVSIAAGRTIAVVGLALWAWPLGVLVLAPAVRRIGRETLEALELDGAGRMWRVRRGVVLMGMLRGPLAVSVAVVGIVMLGSAVPLHVGQIDTFASRLWLRLSLTSDPAAAWVEAWPLVVIAVAVAAVVGAKLRSGTWVEGGEAERGPVAGPAGGASWMANAAAVGVWAAAVLLPLGLFIASLREPGNQGWSLATAVEMSAAFWRVSGGAVWASAGTAAGTGVVGAVVAMAVWCAMSSPRVGRGRGVGMLAMVVVGVWIMAGLAPGVMVGSALGRALAAWEWGGWGGRVADSPAVLVIAHTARFAMVAALVGWWLAALEGREEREMRLMDGAGGLRGWWRTRVTPAGVGAVVGAGLGVAALSFHEIESAVMVQPPGLASLPQLVLEDLHFARDARLAAAAVNLVGVGIVVAGVAGALVLVAGRGAGRGGEGGRPEDSP